MKQKTGQDYLNLGNEGMTEVLYTKFRSAKSRCTYEKNNRYSIYGGRGIEYLLGSPKEAAIEYFDLF